MDIVDISLEPQLGPTVAVPKVSLEKGRLQKVVWAVDLDVGRLGQKASFSEQHVHDVFLLVAHFDLQRSLLDATEGRITFQTVRQFNRVLRHSEVGNGQRYRAKTSFPWISVTKSSLKLEK